MDAPPFDPTKPFQTEDGPPPFDPNKPFQAADDGAPMAWGDVAGSALSNAIPSLGKLAVDTVTPFMHPIDTAQNLYRVGSGAANKLLPGYGSAENEKYADAVGQFFADRYGGMENVKKTMATDPAGFLADVSTVLSAGAALPARASGTTGRVANVVSSVGRAVDPLAQTVNAAAKTARGVGYLGSEIIGGLGTHTGGQSLRTAASAGFQGGDAAQAFRDSLRGNIPMEGVVADAKAALTSLRDERRAAYKAGMTGVAADTTPLDFSAVDAAVDRANKIKNFKGQELSPKTTAVRSEIADTINEWKALDPAEYHTASGLDALKQKIGDIKDAQPYNSPQRAVANSIYGSIRETIVKQAPDYAKVMGGYEKASELISEMERTLSLNPKASIDTSLRKLQSIMRNDASTNYGKRADLGNILETHGAPNLMEKLAGQVNNPIIPRGLGRVTALPQMGLAYLMNPYLLAATPVMSPRLMGESAYYGGRAAKALSYPFSKIPEGSVRPVSLAAMNEGRLESQMPDQGDAAGGLKRFLDITGAAGDGKPSKINAQLMNWNQQNSKSDQTAALMNDPRGRKILERLATLPANDPTAQMLAYRLTFL